MKCYRYKKNVYVRGMGLYLFTRFYGCVMELFRQCGIFFTFIPGEKLKNKLKYICNTFLGEI